MKYKAFISYAHKDQLWATRIQRKLEGFRASDRSDVRWPLRPVFLDRSELASSPDLSASIESALINSDALIVVCSPASATSKWVNAEIKFFKQLGKSAIYPIIVAGDPGSPNPAEQCFPEALRYKLDEAGNITPVAEEPLAADARKGGDGNDALLKLIAGLLAVPFDSLKLRQQRRRVRMALSLAGGAAAMLVLTSYLAVSAILARQDAELRRDQAENLISFMLGDLRDRLRPVGRLDVLDEVGEKALEYFSSLDESDLSPDALLTRATALRQIGEVRVAQGQIDEGLVAFNEALDLLMNSGTGNEGVRLFELGQINYWIADAHFNQLQLDEAQTYIEKYLDISRQLVNLEPDNSKYVLELRYAEMNLGTLALRSNQYLKAREHINNSLEIARTLESRIPADQLNSELASTLSWLAAVEENIGNMHRAGELYGEQVSLRRVLLGFKNEPSRRQALARSLYLFANCQSQKGQPGDSVNALNEAVQIYRELVAYDPSNFDWQRELAWSLTLLARDGHQSGRNTIAESKAMLAIAAETLANIADENTAVVSRVRASIDAELARIELIEGNFIVAQELSERAVYELEDFLAESDRSQILPVFAKAAYLRAESIQLSGNPETASQIAESALAQLEVRVDDPVEIRAYGALLAYIAGMDSANHLLELVSTTEYRATVPVPGTMSAYWWQSTIN